MRVSNILFLMLLLFVPTLAHADIFAQFAYNPGGCSSIGGFNLDCSVDYEEGLFSAISCKVLKVFNAGIIPLYCSIVTSQEYLSAVNAAMVLFLIFWGISFIIGSVPATTGTAFTNLIKMALIYTFATNADIFFDFVYVTVLSIPAEVVGIVVQSNGGDSTDFFQYVDKHFTAVFQQVFKPELADGATEQKVDVRLFVLGYAVGKLVPGGAFITGLFYTVISGWLMAYITIMVRYLVAIMALIFLLMLGPLFIPTRLFKAMQFLFDEWWKMLISFTLQIIVVVIFLVMIEPFFKEFLELVKLGFNEIVLERGYEQVLVSQGKTSGGETVDAIFEKYGANLATSERYISQIEKPVGEEEFVPWFVFKLLSATVVIYLSYMFMRQVPRFAALIAGNPKFTTVIQAATDGDFGTGSRGPALSYESKLKSFVDQGNPRDSGALKRSGGPTIDQKRSLNSFDDDSN